MIFPGRAFFREVWFYKELFYFLVWKEIKIRYKQAALGASWALIQPFFTMLIFTLFFGKLAKIPSDGVPYPIFSYSALLPWTYFSQVVTNAGNSVVAQSNLITKVYFPRIAVPSSSVFAGLVDFSIATSILLLMFFYYRISPSLELLLWPVLVLFLILFALGVGMIFAALNVRYRDIKYTIPFLMQFWLFLTPVIYPSTMIPERFRFLIALNPMCGIIEGFRASMLPTKPMDWGLLGVSFTVTLVVFLGGLIFFQKMEKAFADII